MDFLSRFFMFWLNVVFVTVLIRFNHCSSTFVVFVFKIIDNKEIIMSMRTLWGVIVTEIHFILDDIPMYHCSRVAT